MAMLGPGLADGSRSGKGKEACSFLKKRTKKLLVLAASASATHLPVGKHGNGLPGVDS